MENKSEIEKIKRKILPILREHRVTKAGIFGSYARGEQKKKSDIDILVEIGNGTDLIELIRLKRSIEKSLKKDIDLVEYAGVRKQLKHQILNEEIRII